MQRDKPTPQRNWFDEWTTVPGQARSGARAAGASSQKLTDSSRRLLRVTASDWLGPAPAEKPRRKS